MENTPEKNDFPRIKDQKNLESLSREEKEEKIPTMKELLGYDIVKREEVVNNLIQIYIKEQEKKKGIFDEIEKQARQEGKHEASIGSPKYPPEFINVLKSIYDEEEAKNLAWDIESKSGFADLSEQIIAIKPDLIFLLVRSAVPAGFVYKSYVKEIQKMAEQEDKDDLVKASKEIPTPKFILADSYINKWEEDKKSFDKAVKRYEKKLQKFKYLGQQKDSPIKIGVFDESVSTGLGLTLQKKAVEQASLNIGLNVKVFPFEYPGGRAPRSMPPEIPLPISFIPKTGDILPEIKKNEEDKSFDIYRGGVHSRWKNLYEQQSMRLAELGGKLELKSDLERFKSSLRKVMEWHHIIERKY